MIVMPTRKPIGDASRQPKVLAPPKPLSPKAPCSFCQEVRTIVKGVIETVSGKRKRVS